MIKFAVLIFTFLFSIVPFSYAADSGAFKKVLIVVLENTDYQDAIKEPFLKKLAGQGALLTKMSGVTHPSQGNYVALLAGSTLGVKGDEVYNLDQTNLVDLLEQKGYNWKAYIEDFPGNCFLGATNKRYVRKHNPFMSFKNISSNPDRCKKIQDLKAFDQDAVSGNLPHFAIFSPNLSNDGHDTGVAFASRWLEQYFAARLQNPQFMKDLLVVVTFDESRTKNGNPIYTVLLGDSIVPGTKSSQPLNHIHLLKTVETQFNLGDLGRLDKKAEPITGIWK